MDKCQQEQKWYKKNKKLAKHLQIQYIINKNVPIVDDLLLILGN
jgi:hypothetical protein